MRSPGPPTRRELTALATALAVLEGLAAVGTLSGGIPAAQIMFVSLIAYAVGRAINSDIRAQFYERWGDACGLVFLAAAGVLVGLVVDRLGHFEALAWGLPAAAVLGATYGLWHQERADRLLRP